jgi:hypothetical protein
MQSATDQVPAVSRQTIWAPVKPSISRRASRSMAFS